MPLEHTQEEPLVNHVERWLVFEVVQALPKFPQSPQHRVLPHLHLFVALLMTRGGCLWRALGGRDHIQLLQCQELGLGLVQEDTCDQAHLLDDLKDVQRVKLLANQLVGPEELLVTLVPTACKAVP